MSQRIGDALKQLAEAVPNSGLSADDVERLRLELNRLQGSGEAKDVSQVRGWVKIAVSGGTPSIVKSQNVSSITDNGVGDFTVSWGFAIDSHVCVATVEYVAGVAFMFSNFVDGAQTSSSDRVRAIDDGGVARDPKSCHVVVFG